jgi:hypothetical protein
MQLYKCHDDNFSRIHEAIIKEDKTAYTQLHKELVCSSKLLRGSLARARRENPLLFEKQTCEAPRRGFPDVLQPGATRNDLYVTLINGVFERTSSKVSRTWHLVPGTGAGHVAPGT